jgi:hypothetical protein
MIIEKLKVKIQENNRNSEYESEQERFLMFKKEQKHSKKNRNR